MRCKSASVSPSGLDVTAFVGVAVAHPKYFAAFDERVAKIPEILEAHRVAGRDSYLLKVRTTNTRTLDELLVKTLRTITGVTRTETTIVLASLKEDTFVPVPPSEEEP